VEDFLDGKHEGGEHHALGPDDPVHKVPHVIVVGNGKRGMQPRHTAAFHDFGFAVGA
jgi:hypothetical protein